MTISQMINEAKECIACGQFEAAYIELNKCISKHISQEQLEQIINLLSNCKDLQINGDLTISRDIVLSRAYSKSGNHEIACRILLKHVFCAKTDKLQHKKKVKLFNAFKESISIFANVSGYAFPETHSYTSYNSKKTCELIYEFYLKNLIQGDSMITPGIEVAWSSKRLTRREYRMASSGSSYIEFLKHFSSSNPIMQKKDEKALGGGYLVVLRDYNIVIDPGHHFLDNFFEEGYRIKDIDAIIVTHFHDDHYADFPSLLSLLHKYSERKEDSEDYTVDLFLDETTKKMFWPIIKKSKIKVPPNGSSEYVRRIECLRRDSEKSIEARPGIEIITLPTYHKIYDLKKDTGIGLHLRIRRRYCNCDVLITGDTGWNDELGERYRKIRCESKNLILVAHISSVYPKEILNLYRLGKSETHKSHLCIYGLCKAIEAAQPNKVVLSEIGKEFAASTSTSPLVSPDLPDPLDSLCSIVSKLYGVECLVGQMGRDSQIVYLEDT